MFWRRRKDIKSKFELPALEHLEKWVYHLLQSLQLEKGTFTFLPAYGGLLLFIKNEGISWIPYTEIREALGKIDKLELAETSTMLSSLAVVVATGGAYLPILLVPKLLKGSYRTIAKPPPAISRTFLKSMIKEIVIKETKVRTKLLKTFEEDPYKDSTGKSSDLPTYQLVIKRRFFDHLKGKSPSIKIAEGIKSFFTRSIEPIFSIPQASEINKFADILEMNQIQVRWIEEGEEEKKENAFSTLD